ncbi:PLC-like phosphodiesterase [Trametopsis cervina]|nr:PLC-like phosphodiesterase [Trametopsis cervina]
MLEDTSAIADDAASPPIIVSPEQLSSPPAIQVNTSIDDSRIRPLSTIHEPAHLGEHPGDDSAETPQTPSTPSTAAVNNFAVPPLLLSGVPMLKVSAKKQKQYFFRLDADEGQIIWQSKKLRIIPIEAIKEIRTGPDARYYREQFQLASSYEDRWLTLVYVLDGSYKTLHLIAATRDVFQMWDVTVRRLYEIRKQLMSGLGHGAMRQAVWEKQFWKSADVETEQKLNFDDVEKMCRRLNINPSRDDLKRRFNAADTQNRGYLDFNDFRKFVKALKARPELDRLYKKLVAKSNSTDGYLRYPAFEAFMRNEQKSSASDEDLRRLFAKYGSLLPSEGEAPMNVPSSPARNPLELAIHSASITANTSPSDAQAQPSPDPADTSTSHLSISTSTSPPAAGPEVPPAPLIHETGIMTSRGFTSFLLSPDNAVFKDEEHDMTKPLPEYYISSSHNTYLVGHQLVGESTIEGYIRALLHSCRSVELDIYDGESEPVIYHGKTLTTRIPLRDICQAIMRYAFVTSPYPIIISAEVHCGLTQQALIASIMRDVFGDALVEAPVEGRPRIETLPSPEDLKGRVLLKAKNLYVTEKDGIHEADVTVDTESSSTETSASDIEFKEEIKRELKHELRKAREGEAEMIKGLKSEMSKAKRVLERVNPRRASASNQQRPAIAPAPSSGSNRSEKPKVKMSFELVALLVYTVGVKCRGINKKEVYAPEHVFSLSENTANKVLKQSMMDLIKHNKTHLVRTYPKGTRIGSTNYEPHRYWSAGCQLVAINWQTFDLGYMINHAMFQRNARLGYVLKPPALRNADKQLLSQRTQHFLELTIISAQQLPRPKDALGREIIDKSILDPFVEVSLHIPEWTHSPFLPPTTSNRTYSPPSTPSASALAATSARTVTIKTFVVKNNGFNPVWEQPLSLPFDCVGDMLDLIFVRFAIKQEDKDDEEPLALYCSSLASFNLGYRHLPLHDAQLSQYLFSTLFIRANIRNAATSA